MQSSRKNGWMKCAGAVALMTALAGCATQGEQQATKVRPPVMTSETLRDMSADQAIQLLQEGNARFVSGTPTPHNYRQQVRTTGSNGQFPFASIVSCIDSRSAPSVIFDLGIGDIFSTRVAGNVINEDILGSLEYGSKVVGTKLIVVLGHTSCGAVKGACDNVEMGNLSGLLAKIRPAVDVTADVNGPDRSSHNYRFVDAVAENNVRLMVQSMHEKSPVLGEMAASGQIKIVGAMLDVKTGKVKFL
ncbi:MAG: carbonic anhydrase family protein [Oxalicibacterium faecigallinarum]|uniref:carbonic anhydrase family protein n=1 Tax=Oxalicibacterium faecigallinarum TaxID=573741 RepID=UPI00280937AB|nr:carbonic anhydrase family protein [Oxalicibacterium faecigallinarum]MDQ7970445.1 carbonic anhydrase family protein [Oxalicibacterium faecigallinarum]